VNVTTYPGGIRMTRPEPTNMPIPLRGESLRNKSNPTVSELMARRALEIPADNPNSYDLPAGCEMGLKLAAWDPKAAAVVVKTLSKRCATVMKYSGAQMHSGPQMVGWLEKLALVRARAGDTNAFDDYAAWISATTPGQLTYSISETLKPMDEYPTNTVLQSAAVKMFGDTNSPWARLPWQNNGMDNPASSELVNMPAFRELLARELDRKEVRGSVSWHAGVLDYSMSNFVMGTFMYAFPESQQITNGTSTELRWCDWIALSISNGKHTSLPPYNPFAPEATRDEALDKIKAWLREN
jgi:hypothetical protein